MSKPNESDPYVKTRTVQCRVCGQTFQTTSRMRHYCGDPDCEDERYRRKMEKKRKAYHSKKERNRSK